jgi:hypothetical protein
MGPAGPVSVAYLIAHGILISREYAVTVPAVSVLVLTGRGIPAPADGRTRAAGQSWLRGKLRERLPGGHSSG